MHGAGRVKIALFMKTAPDYPQKNMSYGLVFFLNDYIQYSGSCYFHFFFFSFFLSEVVR